jgi:hypothetical protein
MEEIFSGLKQGRYKLVRETKVEILNVAGMLKN